jgi:hypothetical protein
VLNRAVPTDAAQVLYSLPRSDYRTIARSGGGLNGGAGYSLVSGLGTAEVNRLIRGLWAYVS